MAGVTYLKSAAWVAALAVLGPSLLPGCGERTSPFTKVDGVWHYHKTPIGNTDAKSFVPLDDHYAKDQGRVYYADTFRKGQEYYSIRHDRVVDVAGADPSTFKVLRQGYAKDARNVYYEGVRFAVKDAPTFELLDYGFARDRAAAYYQQAEIAGSDPATFDAIDTHYGKDGRRVYYGDIVAEGDQPRSRVAAIDGADPASFRRLDNATDQADAEDAHATYLRGTRTPK